MLRRVLTAVSIVGLLCALLAISCGEKRENVVAKFGKNTITLGDINLAHKAITVFNRPPLVTYEDCEAFLNTLINKDILVDEAVARGLAQDAQLLKDVEQWTTEQAIMGLYKEVSKSDVEFTVEELKDYYRLSRAAVKVRHIQVKDQALAEEIAGKLKAGDDFVKLAAAHSIDTRTASRGGEVGVVRLGQVDASLERVVFNLKQGEISEPLKVGPDFEIIQAVERTEANMEDFDKDRAVIATELRTRKSNEAWNAYLANVKATLDLKYNDENLNWLNALLPERGTMDVTWMNAIGEQDRSRVLVGSVDGDWTVGAFLDYIATMQGPQPFATENGVLIRSVIESYFVNKKNIEEAKKRALDKSDAVVREIEKRKEERLVDLVYADLTHDAVVSEERMSEEYENQKGQLTTPERVQLQLIVVKERPLADQIERDLRAGASFDELARKHNKGRLQEKAGILELLPKENLSPELHRYAFELLKPGEISPVIASQKSVSFFIVKLLAKEPEHPTTFEEAKPTLQEALLKAEQEKVLNEWLDKKKQDLGVKVFPEKLNLLLETEEEGATAGGGEEAGS